jgi:hypothetical protein
MTHSSSCFSAFLELHRWLAISCIEIQAMTAVAASMCSGKKGGARITLVLMGSMKEAGPLFCWKNSSSVCQPIFSTAQDLRPSCCEAGWTPEAQASIKSIALPHFLGVTPDNEIYFVATLKTIPKRTRWLKHRRSHSHPKRRS